MPRKMKAGIYHGPKDIRIEEIDVPPVPPRHVLVDTKASGICGSDLHRYLGEWEQPKGKVATGHELSGVVVEVGKGVSEVAVGDRVCTECFYHCGNCAYCRTGQYNLCDNIRYISLVRAGGFAEYSLLPASSLFKLPESLSFEEGALVEPLAVSYRAVNRTQADRRDRVAILGAGTIGLLCLATAKAIGVRETIISAKYEHQARMAENLGANHVIRITSQDLREEAMSVSGGSGVDAVLDTVASGRTFDDALAIVRKAGIVCLVGGYTRPLSVHLAPIVNNELHIVGSLCYGYSGLKADFDASIELIASGRVDPTSIVTHRFPLEEIGEAFRIAADKTSGSIKVLICQ
ncbi:MAG: zinc-binding dehydrogenase [Candidatus Bathyarchaeia archaeon]